MRARVCVIVAIAGCTGGAPVATFDAFAPPDAAGCPVGTALAAGTSTGYDPQGAAPLDGVQVCVVGRDDLCATATDGAFNLCVPIGADYLLRARHVGYATTVLLRAAGDPGPPATINGADAYIAGLWQDSGATYPPTTAALLFVALDAPAGALAGATITVAPGAGTVSYGDSNLVAHRALAATSSSGSAYVGDLPAGAYDVTVATASGAIACANQDPRTGGQGGFASPVPGAAARVPIEASATTFVYLRCTP
jgi:hypothetical protein